MIRLVEDPWESVDVEAARFISASSEDGRAVAPGALALYCAARADLAAARAALTTLRAAATYVEAVYRHVDPDQMSLGQEKAWAELRAALGDQP